MGLGDWPIPTKCQPCACLWAESFGGTSGTVYYDPNGWCPNPAWGFVGQNPGSTSTPGATVSGDFLMPLDGHVFTAAASFSDPNPPAPLTGVPFFPPTVQITMNGAVVFAFNPAGGSIAFVYTGYVAGQCTFNPAPLAAAGIPVYKQSWTATSRVNMAGIQLATADNTYEDGSYDSFNHADPALYRCLMPYTGPLPSTAGGLVLAQTPTNPVTTEDSGISIVECATNHYTGGNFINSSHCSGVQTYTFVAQHKFQWLP
jgi:hypothetical protein